MLDLRLEYALDDTGLTVTTIATNVGAVRAPFGAGAHPYVTFGREQVDDVVLEVPAAARLLADERGLPTGRAEVAGGGYDFRAARAIGGIELDTAYTELTRDERGRAHIRLGSDGAKTGVWLDGAYRYAMIFTGDPLPDVARRSVAVEPMTCPECVSLGRGVANPRSGRDVPRRPARAPAAEIPAVPERRPDASRAE